MSRTARAQEDRSKSPPVVRDAWHPIQIGEAVTVISLVSNSPPFIEGRAIINGIARGRHRYRVQFIGDPRIRERFVHPCQVDPVDTLAWLVELWRASQRPIPQEEFYPDDL
jgi:hypothetical protein